MPLASKCSLTPMAILAWFQTPEARYVAQNRNSDNKFVDFLEGCLRFPPKERLGPEDALHHEWIMEGHARHAVARDPRGDHGQVPPGSARRGSGRNSLGSTRNQVRPIPQQVSQAHHQSHAQPHHQSSSQHPVPIGAGNSSNGFAFPPIDTSAQMSQTQPKGFRTAGFSSKKVSAPPAPDSFNAAGPSHPTG